MTPRMAAAGAAIALITAGQAALAAASPSPAPSMSAAQSSTMTLTLSQAEQIALASSPTLALARGELESAEGAVGSARAGELPNLTAAGSATRTKSTIPAGAFSANSPAFASLTTAKNGSITLRQLLIDGGRIHDAVQAAHFGTDAAQYNLVRQVQSVEFNVAQAYYLALQARHQLQVARDSLNLAQVQERLVEAQYRAGVASHADVLTAQLPVAQAQLVVAQAVNGEQTQLAAMLNTMGLPSQTAVSISDESATTFSLPGLTDVLTTANARRPDLLAAQANTNAAASSLRSARLGQFPTVSASGSTSTSYSKNDAVTTPANYLPGWTAGVTISIPLFDGGLTRAATAAAQGQYDQANANLRTAQLLVSLNVQQAYLGVQTAAAGLSAADAELSQAKTVLDVTNAQYKSGVTTLPLLLNAQVGLAKAEGDQVNALYSYKSAWQQLLLSEGTIGQ